MENNIIIYTDGGARGNPGPAAVGVVFYDDKKHLIKEYAECLGKTTNNDAEYQAIILALRKAKMLFGKDKAKQLKIEFRSDSELVVRQLSHKYKIEETHLQQLFLKVWNLSVDFSEVKFTHIPREENKEADRLVNEALDRSAATLL